MAFENNGIKDGRAIMAYQPIEKPIPKYFNGDEVFGRKRDCKDFKPMFWNRRYCKLSDKCKKCGYRQEEVYKSKVFYEGLNEYYSEKMCTGIDKDRWQKIVS